MGGDGRRVGDERCVLGSVALASLAALTALAGGALGAGVALAHAVVAKAAAVRAALVGLVALAEHDAVRVRAVGLGAAGVADKLDALVERDAHVLVVDVGDGGGGEGDGGLLGCGVGVDDLEGGHCLGRPLEVGLLGDVRLHLGRRLELEEGLIHGHVGDALDQVRALELLRGLLDLGARGGVADERAGRRELVPVPRHAVAVVAEVLVRAAAELEDEGEERLVDRGGDSIRRGHRLQDFLDEQVAGRLVHVAVGGKGGLVERGHVGLEVGVGLEAGKCVQGHHGVQALVARLAVELVGAPLVHSVGPRVGEHLHAEAEPVEVGLVVPIDDRQSGVSLLRRHVCKNKQCESELRVAREGVLNAMCGHNAMRGHGLCGHGSCGHGFPVAEIATVTGNVKNWGKN